MSAPASAAAASSSSSSAVAASSSAAAASLSRGQHLRDDDAALSPPSKRPRSEDAEAATSASAAADAPAPRVHLHRHALESVFACLDLPGLASVTAVSRDWQAAAGSMRSCNLSFSAESDTFMQAVFSELRRHVSAIDFFESYTPRPETLALLHLRLPHLTRISSIGLAIDISVSSLRFPPSLQELVVTGARIDQDNSNMLLRSIGQLSQLRRLVLCLEYSASLSFAPLASMAQLRALTIEWGTDDEGNDHIPHLSDVQVDQLRALADLDSFVVPMSPANAAHLLRAPHSLRWRSIHSLRNADDALCALLPGLSCLDTINISQARCVGFDWLPLMQSLTQLDVGLSRDHTDAASATQSLMNALKHCSRITSLSLSASDMNFSMEQLTACLANMPALSSLSIWHASLPSLSFLALPSLALSLQSLTLGDLNNPRPAVIELRHLHGLRSLRQLRLINVLASPLDADSRAVFQPPSQLLPMLTKFEAYTF